MPVATATRKTRKLVCTFDELGETQKENAREWMRELEMQDFGSDDVHLEPAETAGRILGIDFELIRNGTTPDIRWSGFCSHGDGASFVGSYSHAPNSPATMREEFGTDTTLHAIADGLNALQCGYLLLTGRTFTAKITQDDNHYVHKYTMGLDLFDDDFDEDKDGDDPVGLSIELEKRVLDLMRDFAQWIYDGLEEEYDYRLSDEAIDDCIRANEYTFQSATGRRV